MMAPGEMDERERQMGMLFREMAERCAREEGYEKLRGCGWDLDWSDLIDRALALRPAPSGDAREQVVRDLANDDPQTFDGYEEPTCHYCQCGYRLERGKTGHETMLQHAGDCLWIRARALSSEEAPSEGTTLNGEVRERIAVLEEALRPFAVAADTFEREYGAEMKPSTTCGIYFSALCDARRALLLSGAGGEASGVAVGEEVP